MNKTAVNLLLLAAALGLAGFGWIFVSRKATRQLPYIDIRMVDSVPHTYEGKLSDSLHKVLDFKLTDQDGKPVTLADFKGSVFAVDFFFTNCKTICPSMNAQMMRVSERFKNNPNVKIASFTVDPERDSVEAMNNYAKRHNADPKKWKFITGSKPDLYKLGRASFAVVSDKGNGGEHDFIHSNLFVLIDQDLHIRGYYDGVSGKEVDQMMADIDALLQAREN